MKTLRDTLVMPLLFGGLAVGAGVGARLLVDSGQPVAAGGTSGMLAWILAPAVLALLFRRLDPETRQGHFFRLTVRTIGIAGALAVLVAVAVGSVIAVGLAVGGLSFRSVPVSAATLSATVASVALFAFLEEAAWRGYLLPSLLSRARYLVVVSVASLVWFAWHLPYLDRLNAALTAESVTTLAPRLLLGVIALQFLYTEVFLRFRSVWLAVTLHATTNVVAQVALLAGLKLAGPLPWLFSPSADGALLITVSGGVALWLRRRRMSHGAAVDSSRPPTGEGRADGEPADGADNTPR
jgi:membrane protease YdiL (CAAX protease family)